MTSSFKTNLLSGGTRKSGYGMGDAVEVAANVGTGKGAAWKNAGLAALTALGTVSSGVAVHVLSKTIDRKIHKPTSLTISENQVDFLNSAIKDCIPGTDAKTEA